MRLSPLSLAAMLALSACAREGAPEQTTPAPPVSPVPAEAPALASTPPPPKGAAMGPGDDCGAVERKDWIGRVRSELPTRPADALWRIYETGQPVTQDLRRNRLNIEIDPASQKVVRLSCG